MVSAAITAILTSQTMQPVRAARKRHEKTRRAAPGPMRGRVILALSRAAISRTRSRVHAPSRAAFPASYGSGRSAHCGEEPRQPQARRPILHRLIFDGEIPRTDHGIHAPDQIINGQQSYASRTDRNAAVGGVVTIVAHDEKVAGRHDHVRRFIVLSACNHLEDWMLVSARQRLDIARCRCNATVLDFCFASASGTETGRNAIDPHLSVVQPDPVTGQSDHTLHPDLRSVTWPSKYDNVASFGQRGKDARRLGKD